MWLARTVARFPRTTLVVSVLVTLLALLPASRVRFVTELADLLPAGSPAAEDYRVFLEQLGGFEKVFVLVELDDSEPATAELEEEERTTLLTEAALLLAEQLETSPEVADARAGIEPEDERFLVDYVLPRAPLLLGDDWRRQVQRRLEPPAIRQRVSELRDSLLSPSGSFTASFLRSDPLGFSEDLPELQSLSSSLPLDPLSLTFLSADGSSSLVILTPSRSEIDPEGGRLLLQELQAATAAVSSELEVALRISALGGPLYAAHDEQIIRQDLSRTVTGSVIGCTVLLVAAFEGVLIPLAALLALAMALLWTGALIGLTLQQISAVGIGFAAVLVGLGIDYCIHGGARYRQALAGSDDRGKALVSAFRHSGPGILTSALTTAAAFAVLGCAHLRPLRELGLVVAIGIMTILVASATAGAAVIVLPRQREAQRNGLLWRLMGRVVEGATSLAGRRPRVVVLCSAVLTVAACFGLNRLALDADLRSLRPVDHPVLEAERLLVERFALGLDTVTVLVPGDSLDEALVRAAAVEELLRAELGPDADITSPARWLASGELLRQRLAVLAELPLQRAQLDLEAELRRAGLAPAAFKTGLDALASLAVAQDPGRAPRDAWPGWLSELVREGSDGAWVGLRLRLDDGTWPAGPPAVLVARIKERAPGAAIASAVAIGSELRILAGKDLERLGLLALVVVVLVVVVSFRGRPGQSALAAAPVLLGTIWVLGLWGWLGRSIDLMGLAVLPIMLGIGIDDGLHALHGARSSTKGGISGAVRAAGRAMVLTTLTTSIGFGSLLLSRIPGLRNGGLLVSLGVLACLAATLLVLPACEALVAERKLKPRGGDPPGP